VEPREPEGIPDGPPPSLWPLGFAIGIACILVGLVVSWPAVAVGAALTLVFGFLWVRDAMSGEEHAPPAPPPRAAPVSAAATAPALPAHQGPAAMPEPTEAEIEAFPRSKFLELSTLGLGGVIGGLVTLPAVGFAVIPAFEHEERPNVDLGPVDDFPEGEFVIATFLLDPKAGEVSRRTAYVRNNGNLSFTIVSNRCVHLGCPVQAQGLPLEDEKKEVRNNGALLVELTPLSGTSGFGCPCHGGAYDPEGNRRAGPPVRALDRYSFKVQDNRLILLDTYSVSEVEGTGADAKIKAYELAMPGVHVDGPEAWLYPLEPQDVNDL
jgi:Rieske Fe-S protein